MPSPDSPDLEMESAGDARARAARLMSDRIADEAWAVQMELTALRYTCKPADANATVECRCGLIIPGNLNSSLFVMSPRTGIQAEIDRFADQLPPRVRRRIVNADQDGTRKARFTLLELKGIARVYKLCKEPMQREAGPMVSTGNFTFARKHRR